MGHVGDGDNVAVAGANVEIEFFTRRAWERDCRRIHEEAGGTADGALAAALFAGHAQYRDGAQDMERANQPGAEQAPGVFVAQIQEPAEVGEASPALRGWQRQHAAPAKEHDG